MGLNEAQKKERSEYLEKNLAITECSQRKPYVFISYASDNWEAVFKSAVVPMQRQYGLRVYADKAFDKVNDKWIVPMLRNARGADVIIAFISQSYIESYACFLELLTAVNNKKPIVFVSLEDQLHLGDTTDLPVIERGAKNEILNQGANISTNTNNTSNDIMRAMKSAYTSMSTLLEQDALSRYDISDAFINFFRDAAINRKTINDLGAVRRTIKSVSRDVFDKSLVVDLDQQDTSVPKQKQPPVTEAKPIRKEEPDPAPAEEPELIRKEEPAPTPAEDPEPEPIRKEEPDPAPAEEPKPVPPQEPEQKKDDSTSDSGQKLKKPLNIKLIGGIVAAAAVLAVLFIMLSGPGKVTDQPYAMTDGNSDTYSGLYTGEWDKKNERPNGTGTFVMEDVAGTYEGEWVDGVTEGQGTIVWDSGDHYEGEWKDGMRNGQGTYTSTEGDGYVYEGEFQNNERSGKGTMTWETGEGVVYVYEGEFQNNERSGKGTMTWGKDGETTIYEGDFADNWINGYGTCTWPSGDHYEGEWKNGKFNGKGTITYAGGSVYEGEFVDNKKNGEGIWTKSDGTAVTENWIYGKKVETLTLEDGTYTGGVTDGKPDGQGKMEYTNGQVYEGEWKNGVRSGQGRCTWPDGGYYDGEWANDKWNGQGTNYIGGSKDVSFYVGGFVDGERDGHGIYTWPSGDSIETEWVNGVKNGKGTYTWSGGTVAAGEYVDDEWDGEWTITYADGTVETRQYDHGTRLE
ncbi:MAG: TIR domain-containing protein [Lachnospiraceae bacterium]|nr:TIR domain-containing protein [Lachnospiraceae bacterium]